VLVARFSPSTLRWIAAGLQWQLFVVLHTYFQSQPMAVSCSVV